MGDITAEQANAVRASIAKFGARISYGVARSTPSAYLQALPSSGVGLLGTTSISQTRRARLRSPDAELVLTVDGLASSTLDEAYRSLGVRVFRVGRAEQLRQLIDVLGTASDLTIIVQLPDRTVEGRNGGGETAEMLVAARRIADVLGIGYSGGDPRGRRPRPAARFEEMRAAIVSAAVTVDVVDVIDGPYAGTSVGDGTMAFFDEVQRSFESMPISYSAELWVQPGAAFFERELLHGWRAAGEMRSPEVAETYFVSYATEDEPIAREVVSVIESRGGEAVVQFRDFSQRGFVRAMREGIERADRFVALQSARYWASDHCQAEWDAAYARDPGGRRRFIVPFLLEPTPLPPIASELVHKSLFGLDGAGRRSAIADWIGYVPRSRPLAELRRELADQASPDVQVRERRLHAGPNERFDRPVLDHGLAGLPAELRALVDVLTSALPRNAPPIVRSCLEGYRRQLSEHGAQPILGVLVPLADSIEAQRIADAGLWDAGLDALFGHFMRSHQLLITHFPLNPERELLFSETPVDEALATGARITDPVHLVGDALALLHEAGLTTADFNDAERAHQEFGRDVASLPMPSAGAEGVTPKRRFVLGTIGYYERMLAALGGLASIGGAALLPEVQAAIATAASALRQAIDALLRLVV
jgi:hypothetical protein